MYCLLRIPSRLHNVHLCMCVCVCVCVSAQQTQCFNPMLVQCWASVEDGGPTLNQHWVDVSCLLGARLAMWANFFVCKTFTCANHTSSWSMKDIWSNKTWHETVSLCSLCAWSLREYIQNVIFVFFHFHIWESDYWHYLSIHIKFKSFKMMILNSMWMNNYWMSVNLAP